MRCGRVNSAHLFATAILVLLFSCAYSQDEDVHAPKVGFEIELNTKAIRYYANYPYSVDAANVVQAADNVQTENWRLANVEEKQPLSTIARTRGMAPDIDNWPLFKVTIDNAKMLGVAANLYAAIDAVPAAATAIRVQPNQLQLPGGRSATIRRWGVIEIVTGPVVYNAALRNDVISAVRVLLTVMQEQCAASQHEVVGSRFPFYEWRLFQEDYNQRILQHDFATPHIAPLMLLQHVEHSTPYVPTTAPDSSIPYVDCRRVPNGLQLVKDVQITFGIPLERVFTYADTTWGDLDTEERARWGQQIDLAWPDGGTRREELKGLLRIWASLLSCAFSDRPRGEQYLQRPQVMCNKASLLPLPHVDVCELAENYWGQIPQEQRAGRREIVQNILNEWSNRTVADNGFFIRRQARAFYRQYITPQIAPGQLQQTALSMGAPLLEDCGWWHDDAMEFFDATIVRPLRLNTTLGERLGLALEQRNIYSGESGQALLRPNSLELADIIQTLSHLAHPPVTNCQVNVPQNRVTC